MTHPPNLPSSSDSPAAGQTGLFGRPRLTDMRQDCVLCDAADAAILCLPCIAALPRNERACPGCAAPGHPTRCGACLADPLMIDTTVAAFKYQFPLDRLVQSFKFNANLVLVDFFADALAVAVAAKRGGAADRSSNLKMADMTLVALPLANRRLAERGFNQSALIADRLGRILGIAVAHQTMLRIRDTPPQAGLSRLARLKNVRGAFDCAEPIVGKHIVLIDDVLTTGATLSEAAKVLKKAGAISVDAWVLARAVMDDQRP